MNLIELNKYFNSLRDFVVIDNKYRLQFKFENWDSTINLDDLIPDSLIELPFFSYNISLSDNPIKNKSDLLDTIAPISQIQLHELKILITIDIQKTELLSTYTQELDNTYIYFFIEKFINDINSPSEFNIKNDKFLNLYIIDEEQEQVSNDFLKIFNFKYLNLHQSSPISTSASKKIKTIEKIFGETKNIKSIHQLPSFWSIKSNSKAFEKFNHLFLLNTLHLIANKSDLELNSFSIKGHYNLNINFSDPIIEINHNKLEELLYFTIDEDSNRHSERVLIVRNVLTTYLSSSSTAKEFNEKLVQIVSTVWHHFELYVQNEIKVFIDQKNKLLQESITVADKIAQQNIKNNEFFQKNIIIILGLLISNLLPIFQKTSNSFIYSILTLLVVFLISYLNLKTIKDAIKQLNNSINKFEFYVENISNKNLNGLSIEDLKIKFINPDKDILESNLKVHKIILKSIIFITIFISLWLLYYHYPNFYTFIFGILSQIKSDFNEIFNLTTK